MNRLGCVGLVVVVAGLTAGCAASGSTGGGINQARLKHRALNCLKRAVRYPDNPVVRSSAIEALAKTGLLEARPWVRTALLDDEPVVRFAGCVAIGELVDHQSVSGVRERLGDDDASVRAAALFALHRLGDSSRSGKLASYLLYHEEASVRRNAAFVLGLSGEVGAVKLLARAMRDGDSGVRHLVLEAMARLGNPEAKQELVFMTNAGVGQDEVFAIRALADTGDRAYLENFRYKLQSGMHVETQLAAARGLGLCGSAEGYELALHALRGMTALRDDPNDRPAEQALRIRLLAASALSAIQRADALPALAELLEESPDPRVQVAAAQAILEIIESSRRQVFDGAEWRGKKR